jgi:FtsZ-binding cell division protein ZapB
LDAQVDKNAKDIVNASNNATQSAITLNNLISENKSAIDLLNADYTVGGSVKHTITDSLIAKQASPSANEANDQTLLRQVAGTNTFYASNSTKDMMHGEYVLSTVIEDIKNTTNSTQQEVSELKEKVATLETQMVDAQFRIETLETELSELKNNFEQQVKNIISKTIIGVDKETMVTNVYAPNAEGVEVINQVKIGFDTDAIFNATNN